MILALVNIAILGADNSSQYLLNSIIRVTYARATAHENPALLDGPEEPVPG